MDNNLKLSKLLKLLLILWTQIVSQLIFQTFFSHWLRPSHIIMNFSNVLPKKSRYGTHSSYKFLWQSRHHQQYSACKWSKPSQPQTLTEQSHQLTNDLQVMVSDNQQGTSLQTSTQCQSLYKNSQNIPYTIPHISCSRRTSTDASPTSSTIAQQDYSRQSYRVPHYYSDSHSFLDR